MCAQCDKRFYVLRHDRSCKTFKQDKFGMILAAITLVNQCTSVVEMRTSVCCSCEFAVTVKVTPKKCTWMSLVAVTSQRITKCLHCRNPSNVRM